MLAIVRGRGEDLANPTPRRERDGRAQRRKKTFCEATAATKSLCQMKQKKDRSMIIGSKPGQGAGDHASIYIHSLLTAIFHFLPPHPVSTERGGGLRGLDICIAWERSDISQPFDFKFSFLVWQSFFESFRRREWLTDRRCAPSTYLNSEPLSG